MPTNQAIWQKWMHSQRLNATKTNWKTKEKHEGKKLFSAQMKSEKSI